MTPAELLLTPRHHGRRFQKIPSLVSGNKWSLKFASEEGEARPGGSAQVRGAVLSQRGRPRPLSSAGACVWPCAIPSVPCPPEGHTVNPGCMHWLCLCHLEPPLWLPVRSHRQPLTWGGPSQRAREQMVFPDGCSKEQKEACAFGHHSVHKLQSQ